MKRALVLGFVGVILACAPGCGGNDPDSLVKQAISDMNALASAIEKKESDDKIKAAADKLKATTDKLDALKMSKEDKEKLMKKYEKEMLEAVGKLFAAGMANPAGAKHLEGAMGGGGKKPE